MSRRLPRPRTTALVLLAAGAGLAGTQAEGSLALLGGIVLVCAASAPMWLRLRVDSLDAVGLYGLAGAIFLGLFSIEWLGMPPVAAPGVDQRDVVDALLVAAGALAAASVGSHVWGRVRPVPPLEVNREYKPARSIIIAGFSLSLLATAAGLGLGVINFNSESSSTSEGLLAFSQIILQAANLGGLLILASALLGYAADDQRFLRLAFALIPLQVVAGFLVGFKSLSLLPIVYVGLAYVAAHKRVPWRRVAILVVVAVLVLLPANAFYRTVVRDLPGTPPITPAALADQTYETVSSRFRLIDHVALIVDRTPSQYPFGGEARYTTLPALITVPRAVWAEKPTLDFGEEFSHTYWEIPPFFQTSTPLTQVGDLYRTFGSWGPAVGLAIWGAVIGALTVFRRKNRSLRVELVYLASLTSWITFIEADLPQQIAGMARNVPVMILVAWVVLPGRSSPPGYVRVAGWMRRVWNGPADAHPIGSEMPSAGS